MQHALNNRRSLAINNTDNAMVFRFAILIVSAIAFKLLRSLLQLLGQSKIQIDEITYIRFSNALLGNKI